MEAGFYFVRFVNRSHVTVAYHHGVGSLPVEVVGNEGYFPEENFVWLGRIDNPKGTYSEVL